MLQPWPENYSSHQWTDVLPKTSNYFLNLVFVAEFFLCSFSFYFFSWFMNQLIKFETFVETCEMKSGPIQQSCIQVFWRWIWLENSLKCLQKESDCWKNQWQKENNNQQFNGWRLNGKFMVIHLVIITLSLIRDKQTFLTLCQIIASE